MTKANDALQLKPLIENYLGEDGFFSFPASVKKLKIDVGLSWDAVQSRAWLAADPELGVIGIEPIPNSCDSVLRKLDPYPELSERMLVLPIALGQAAERRVFHISDGDPGSSSFYIPKHLNATVSVEVPCFTLEQLWSFIDTARFPKVDYLKTDCQGADFEVLKGAGERIRDIAVITSEADSKNYIGALNSEDEIDEYLASKGFIRFNPRPKVQRRLGSALAKFHFANVVYGFLREFGRDRFDETRNIHVEDPTYINNVYLEDIESGDVSAFQRG